MKITTKVVEPLGAVPPDEEPEVRTPGMELKPMEDTIRVLSETFNQETECDL